MANTTNLNLPLIDDNMVADVPRDMNALAEAVDTAVVQAIEDVTVPDATITRKGITQLSSAVTSTAEDRAATPAAVKRAYDLASGALPKSGGQITGTTYMQGDIVSNPTGNITWLLHNSSNGNFYISPSDSGFNQGIRVGRDDLYYNGKSLNAMQHYKLTQDSGATKLLPDGYNLDQLDWAGQFNVFNPVNGPGDGWYYIESLIHSNAPTHVMHRATRLDSVVPTFFMRTKTGTWNPWSPDLFQSGVNAKAGAVASLNAMGVSASTSDDWATINAKIRQIYNGKRQASGSLGNLGTNYVSVAGLSFTPSRVDVQYTTSNELITLTLFNSAHPWAASLGGHVGFYTIGEREGYRVVRGSSSGQGNISGGSFWLNFTDAKTNVRWYAYE